MAAFWKTPFGIMSSLHRSERGAALFIILMVVVLYAALSYAVAKTTSGGSGPEREVQMVEAGTVQQNTNAKISEFNRLMIRGCSPTEIYTLSYSPADIAAAGLGSYPPIPNSACTLFNTVGGDLPRILPHPALVKIYTDAGLPETQAKIALAMNDERLYMHNFPGIGTDDSDLYFINVLDAATSGNPAKSIQICNGINKSLGIDFEITPANYNTFASSFVLNPFGGVLTQSYSPAAIPAAFHSHNAGCLMFSSGVSFYYQIVYEQ